MYFFRFSFHAFLFFPPNECPGLCRHRPAGHSLGKKKVARNEKRKKYMGFRILKLWQILMHFAGTFRHAQTLEE